MNKKFPLIKSDEEATTVKGSGLYNIADTELATVRKSFVEAMNTYLQDRSEANHEALLAARKHLQSVEYEHLEARRLLFAHASEKAADKVTRSGKGIPLGWVLFIVWILSLLLIGFRLLKGIFS